MKRKTSQARIDANSWIPDQKNHDRQGGGPVLPISVADTATNPGHKTFPDEATPGSPIEPIALRSPAGGGPETMGGNEDHFLGGEAEKRPVSGDGRCGGGFRR